MLCLSLISIRTSADPAISTTTVQPDLTFHYCLTREEADKVEECIQDNTECHKELQKEVEPDHSLVVVVGLVAMGLGFILGSANR